MDRHLLVIGLGYAGTAIALEAVRAGWRVTGTRRTPGEAIAGVEVVPFAEAGPAFAAATHLVVTAAPGEAGDPTLAAHGAAIRARPPRWIGYVSTTAVYGDRGGATVDEVTEAAPTLPRGRRRREAERAWEALAGTAAVDLFRAGGIYGPGRSALDDLRDGTARRTVKPGHLFARIHRDDIALAVMAAAAAPPPPGVRVLHLVDDEPVESATVIEDAARLLGMPPPEAVPVERAWEAMSPMARTFWSESRRVDNVRTKAALGIAWRHPTYREGLRSILAEETATAARPASG